ncbi:peptidase domain-containing ABC transporter [Methylophilus sp. 14]|uniref:peptidase domain-containing ABC transporter n=1 Tax=Methylophilus sp. 14 TaxID=2781019 RepID=UPI00188EFA06|nr:peptidase domain-containing ABC transporter [Methylophilus sp. 14]MBF4988928.1 peptidase domain-containing ABC transporter [Methylophilus sp. 14]
MSFLNQLSFGLGRTLPIALQTEASECGLACLVMVSNYHGFRTDLATMRRLFLISIKGTTLSHLMGMAQAVGFTTRPVKLELEDLKDLRRPCILHWNFNHFVVLKEVGARHAVIHDPAMGIRKLSFEEVSAAFTGVALELWPNPGFKQVTFKQSVKLRDMMGHVTGLYRSMGQVLLLALALEVFALVSPFYMQWVVDHVLVSADRDLLTTLALGFGLLVFMQQAISTVRAWVIMHMSTTLNVQWRANLFAHLIRLPVDFFEKRHLGDVVSRFGAIDQIQHTLTSTFVEAILDGVLTVATLAMMFLYSPTMAWIAIGAMLLYGLGRWAWFRPLRNATEEQIVHAAKQQTHFIETVRGVRALKLFQRLDERRNSWLGLFVEQVNADLRTQKLQVMYRLLNGLLFGVERILIVWLGAKLVMDGAFTIGVLLAFIAYKDQFVSRVSGLIDRLVEMRMLHLQGERLADIALAEQEPEVVDTMSKQELEKLPANIVIQGLRYRYADGEPWVLDGIDLEIAAGESVAIVGPSGCGKSTLMNVMLGLRPFKEGQVLVGGQPLSKLGLSHLRNMVGTVMQDDALFAGSIADNIAFFDQQVEMAWVEECARKAAVYDDIAAMPMGFNTLIGDMGAALSGGQKQRILLARALYKKPKILFLDEATSHLDVAREAIVNEAIQALDMTRVIIAHRPETIASAKRVIVMAAGKVHMTAVAGA